jgi:hypothetical protein
MGQAATVEWHNVVVDGTFALIQEDRMSRKYVPEILALASTPLMFRQSIMVGWLYA